MNDFLFPLAILGLAWVCLAWLVSPILGLAFAAGLALLVKEVAS